jgi:ABC-2 type transport system permease protein
VRIWLRIALIVVVLAAALARLWRRRDRGSGRGAGPAAAGRVAWLRMPAGLTDALGYPGLVAAREIQQRVRGRAFRFGTVLILVAVAAAILIPKFAGGSGNGPLRVGVVGSMAAVQPAVVSAGAGLGTEVQLVGEPSADVARADLHDGRVDLVVVDAGSILLDRTPGATDTTTSVQLARAVARTLGVQQAFRAAGLTATQVAQVSAARPLPVTGLQPASVGSRGGPGVSVIGLILIFIMLTQYNTWTLIGVMEEKSSRVVEVLLAAIRPVQLLTGKVIGIGLVALAQAAVTLAFALGLARAVGSDLLNGTAPSELVAVLIWLLLGYAFYSWVYAAAGSMVERQDQVQTLAFPLAVPLVFGYIMALTTAGSGSPSTFFQVLAYLPPTAPFAMPVLVGLGVASWWQFTASALISIACTVGLARLAVGIYRRAILRTGSRVKLREVLPAHART